MATTRSWGEAALVAESWGEAAPLPYLGPAWASVVDWMDPATLLAASKSCALLREHVLAHGARYQVNCGPDMPSLDHMTSQLKAARNVHLVLGCMAPITRAFSNPYKLRDTRHCSALRVLFNSGTCHTHLTRITLTKMSLSSIVPVELASSCPNLRHLTLKRCRITPPDNNNPIDWCSPCPCTLMAAPSSNTSAPATCSNAACANHHNQYNHRINCQSPPRAKLTHLQLLEVFAKNSTSDLLLESVHHMGQLTFLHLTPPSTHQSKVLVDLMFLRQLAEVAGQSVTEIKLTGFHRQDESEATSQWIALCCELFPRLTCFDLGTLKHVATEADVTHMLAAPHLTHVTLAAMCLTKHVDHVTPCRWRELCLTGYLGNSVRVQSWAYLTLPPTCKIAVRSTDQVWLSLPSEAIEATIQQAIQNVSQCGGIDWDVPQVAISNGHYRDFTSHLAQCLPLLAGHPRHPCQGAACSRVQSLWIDSFRVGQPFVDALGQHLGAQVRRLRFTSCSIDPAVWAGLLGALPGLSQASFVCLGKAEPGMLRALMDMCKRYNSTATTADGAVAAAKPGAAAGVASHCAPGYAAGAGNAGADQSSSQPSVTTAGDPGPVPEPVHIKLVYEKGVSDVRWWQARVDKHQPVGSSRVHVEVKQLGIIDQPGSTTAPLPAWRARYCTIM